MAAAAAATTAAGGGGAAGPGAGPGGGPGAGGPGPGPPGLEAAIQKLALRRKKVLNAEETELYELALAAGGAIDPDVFKILVDLLKLNVAPLAVFQMLKSMCAGQRLAMEPPGPEGVGSALPPSALPEARGRNKSSGTAVLGERGGREGSSQRMPRQPSASRLPKGGTGKSPTRSSN
ncbi:mitotic-spindle organizing protein 2B isoform X2 [Sminthopsis crassicaudata]|uniref:mitotic-spindle organizing protein 2B isoform X2 n=1 Tax=Sminthopsis crassicaudata TaxID=9301 RepID=UPI003D6817A1